MGSTPIGPIRRDKKNMIKKFLLMIKLRFLTTRHLVQINYKSGNSVKLWFIHFEFSMSNNRKTGKWYSCYKQIILLNLDEIESIFIVKTKLRPFTFKNND